MAIALVSVLFRIMILLYFRILKVKLESVSVMYIYYRYFTFISRHIIYNVHQKGLQDDLKLFNFQELAFQNFEELNITPKAKMD